MPCATMRSFGLIGENSTPMRTWFGPGASGSGMSTILKTVDRVAKSCEMNSSHRSGPSRWIKEQIDHLRRSPVGWHWRLFAFGGAGGTGIAMSVAIRHPSGVLIQLRIIRNGFGTGVCPA